MARKKSGKLRTSFRKKHQGRVREGDLTREFRQGDEDGLADAIHSERLSGKGDLTRKRTIIGKASTPDDAAGLNVEFNPDNATLSRGRVLSVHGLQSKVMTDDGDVYACATRQVLKSLSTDQRHIVVAGDHVLFRIQSRSGGVDPSELAGDGMIESVLPRHGTLHRTSRGKQHILAANVDCVVIVATAAEPTLKPALIDRMILTAHQCGITPFVVINKIDLVDAVDLAPLMGVYGSLGYRVLMTSTVTGQNIDYLRAWMQNRQSVVTGQSGVGKSSLLNAIDPTLSLSVGRVSTDNQKGRHTTTASQLIPIQGGGCVFDTPGIRQFQLWDISAGEVAGYMPDFRPYVSHCRYPNCLHVSEDSCAVKNAVADGQIDARRYDAYCYLLEEELAI
ncbi:MAG: ribosome small subunit-dependent GTPase A [Planctomycetota bacterium]